MDAGALPGMGISAVTGSQETVETLCCNQFSVHCMVFSGDDPEIIRSGEQEQDENIICNESTGRRITLNRKW